MNLVRFFRRDKSVLLTISGRDLAILDTIKEHGEICAADTTSAIEKALGSTVRLVTIYDGILDLERKGLIEHSSMAVAENGGRPRRLFRVTESGVLALELADRIRAFRAART